MGRKAIFAALLGCLVSLMPLVFVPEARADEEQNAYNACVGSWNSERRALGSYAFVSGVGKKRNTCFWRSNSSRNWNDRLISGAMSDCKRKYKKCFLFGTSNEGMRDWSQRVSDNGGLSRGTIAARNNATNQYMFNSAMQLYLQMLNQPQRQRSDVFDNGYRPTRPNPTDYGLPRGYGGGGTGNTGGGSVCTPAQKARGWSEERCLVN